MIEPLEHDDRSFEEWRNDMVEAFEELARHHEARAPLSGGTSLRELRRARTLYKLAQILRQEI